jgi:hypothetical protein
MGFETNQAGLNQRNALRSSLGGVQHAYGFVVPFLGNELTS